ncbi:MAG: trypsin-like peptidase domain-containing protein [Acidobacteria bacterium]|nr:trypsin-like peptidase domain-containing protein [Acidobacteriota bacterium]
MKTADRSTFYHVIIFLSAALVLIAGAALRPDHSDETTSTGLAVLETLSTEVQGLKAALRRSELDSIRKSMMDAAAAATPAVVSIQPRSAMHTPQIYTDTRSGLTPPTEGPAISPGISGQHIGDGYILTSSSAARFGEQVVVLANDFSRRVADVVAVSPTEQLALLRLKEPAPDLATLQVSPSSLRQGEWIISVGRSATGTESVSLGQIASLTVNSAGKTRTFGRSNRRRQSGCLRESPLRHGGRFQCPRQRFD